MLKTRTTSKTVRGRSLFRETEVGGGIWGVESDMQNIGFKDWVTWKIREPDNSTTGKKFKAVKAILYGFGLKCRPFLLFLRFGGRTSSETF